MLYAPHFKLRAFDTLSDDAKMVALGQLLEALTAVNVAWLRENPHAPWLYDSGVRYEEEPQGRDDWQDIPETLALRVGDCEDLGCWRLAELRTRGREYARPYVKRTVVAPGRTVYHVAVRRADGALDTDEEDDSMLRFFLLPITLPRCSLGELRDRLIVDAEPPRPHRVAIALQTSGRRPVLDVQSETPSLGRAPDREQAVLAATAL